MTVKFVNNYGTNISANITSSQTTIPVTTGTGQTYLGTLSGGDVYYMTLIGVGTQSPFEIVQVTQVAGDTLTVVRAQDGTSALAWNQGDAIEIRLPRVVLNLMAQTGGGTLGTIALQNASSVAITGGTITGITDLAVADGGTGASTAANARTNLGAAASGANTDITSLASPALAGATATTQAPGDNTTKVATTAFTTAAIAAQALVAPVLSKITASLGADVALNNTANYFDGPSVAQGSTGTWFASGTVTLEDTSGSARFFAKLWDGTTVIASGYYTGSNLQFPGTISLSGYLASPAGNLRISVRDSTTTSGQIRFNASGNSKDATITALRIA